MKPIVPPVKGELQGPYWDRVGEKGHTLLAQGNMSEEDLVHLARVVEELPSDFEWDVKAKDRLFDKIRQFFTTQPDQVRKVFREAGIRITQHSRCAKLVPV